MTLRSDVRRLLSSAGRAPRRVAMLSVHTSPLEQPGAGDAGGMNVYVVETAKRLATRGTAVEIFTRATSSELPPRVELAPGVLVRHVPAGPYEGLLKDDLPGQLCAFASGVLRAEARHEPGWYDLVHSHYWLSGQVGWIVADRWGAPLVHTMHTMAKVKNLSLADGDTPEPLERVLGEEQVVARSDRLVASTETEARELVDLYGARPDRVAVVPPGADLEVFRPAGARGRREARRRLGLSEDADVLLFVGRIQPLKAPDVLVRATAELVADRRRAAMGARELVVVLLGGLSGTGTRNPGQLRALVSHLGLDGVVRFHPPVAAPDLADWYRAADLVTVPSHNESFGLVAVEAQASGTPVVAASVGGLRTAVRDGVTGVLVDGHDPRVWAATVAGLLEDRDRRRRMGEAAVRHAARFSWEATVERTLDVYAMARTHGCRRAARRPLSASLDPALLSGALAVAP